MARQTRRSKEPADALSKARGEAQELERRLAEQRIKTERIVRETDEAREIFHFRENLAVGMANVMTAKHRARRGYATIEVLDAQNNVIGVDMISVPAAPRGAFVFGGHAATFVVPGETSVPQQELEIPLDGPHPFNLPKHITDKVDMGGVLLRIFWSCEDAT